MVPIGGIINWSGAIVDIPDNWQLCDGTGGTPDLRNEFVVGAGDTYAVDDTGGASVHTHTPGGIVAVGGAGPVNAWQEASSSVESNLPPYFALAYIQRIS